MHLLLEYYDLDPKPNSFIMIYCDNISELNRVSSSLIERGPRHHLVPEYDLTNKLHECINTVGILVKTHHVKGHQDNATDVATLSFPDQMIIPCDKHVGDFHDSDRDHDSF